ncbi:MAG TPA: VWA domain-containing protein [Pyrinomonadaceae bacterium]|jgi:VWFA-related protein
MMMCAPLPPVGAQTPAGQPPAREPFGASLNRTRPQPARTDGAEAKQRPGEDGLPPPEETLKVETLLVSLDVVVTDRAGSRFITGLGKDDFIVVEDERPQEISTLTLGDDAARLPRSIVLILDWSGSQAPYLAESVRAAKTLVDQLTPTDQMAIVTDDVKLAIDFTGDKKRLKSTLDSFMKLTGKGWHGKSRQFSALLATLRELIDVEQRRPIIIFQTDGDEAERLKDPPRGGSNAPGVYYMSDINAEVEKSRVKIYTVIPSPRLAGASQSDILRVGQQIMARVQEHYIKTHRPEIPAGGRPPIPDNVVAMVMAAAARQQAAAAHVAELSGGWTAFLETPERAAEIYARILEDINHRYIIGYYPTNKERDGKPRRVRIEVRGHPEYTVHGRQSYYATQR